ncbi:DNA-binding response OmpR family regulator [Nakamurella sp. UYEF19]
MLIIDGDPVVREVLRRYLVRAGYEVLETATGAGGVAAFHHYRPDLVVLELMVPEMDGLAVCRQIRQFSNVPVVILSVWGSESDRVVGLECGADDYVVKPFSPRELTLRVAGLLRRAPPRALSEGADAQETYCCDGDLVLDVVSRTVVRNGWPLALTARGFELLRFLIEHPGRVFTREQLLTQVWG